jgi:ATP-binding cassette subfamily C (CFTR/MRP) protein 1
MIRAALISIIFKSSLDIAVGTVEVSSPVSLMGADVERVMSTLQWVISTGPNIIQVAVAIWILEIRLGVICVAPVIIVLSMLKVPLHCEMTLIMTTNHHISSVILRI